MIRARDDAQVVVDGVTEDVDDHLGRIAAQPGQDEGDAQQVGEGFNRDSEHVGRHVVAGGRRRLPGRPRSLRGRVFMITGASRGIGRGIALELASLGGFDLAILDNEDESFSAFNRGFPTDLFGYDQLTLGPVRKQYWRGIDQAIEAVGGL